MIILHLQLPTFCMSFILKQVTGFSMAQTKLAVNSPKTTDGIGLLLPATEKWGIAVERCRGSMLLILLPPGTDSSQLSQLLGLGILPIVSTPTLGAAAASVNLSFPVLIWKKLVGGSGELMHFVFPVACHLRQFLLCLCLQQVQFAAES